MIGWGIKLRVTGTGVGDSGVGISAIGRGNPEPAAESWKAETRRADGPVAGTRHLRRSSRYSYVVTRFRPYLLHRFGQLANRSTDQLTLSLIRQFPPDRYRGCG